MSSPPRDDDVIELLSDDDNYDYDSEDGNNKPAAQPKETTMPGKKPPPKTRKASRRIKKKASASAPRRELQAGLVLEEDVDHLVQKQRENGLSDSDNDNASLQSEHENSRNTQLILYHDPHFQTLPSSIYGSGRRTKVVEKCRCKFSVILKFVEKAGPTKGRPYFYCGNPQGKKCKFFKWALTAETFRWFRFGLHTGHQLVNDTGFSANDLVQGKVGDCWFLSALAVVAERPDLIMRLFGSAPVLNAEGKIQVRLFIDGWWKLVTIDNFLPCLIDEKGENELQQAMHASMELLNVRPFQGKGYRLDGSSTSTPAKDLPSSSIMQALYGKENRPDDPNDSTVSTSPRKNIGMKREPMEEEEEVDPDSSKYDPFAMTDENRQVLANALAFLQEQKKPAKNPYAKKKPGGEAWQEWKTSDKIVSFAGVPRKLHRSVTTEDLAYSKARNQQLWVPFLEKAYAASHGCYSAISGGHIAEAFLDLTGAPTMVYRLHNEPTFNPKLFWYKLLRYRQQRLPMGCGTDQSQVGIVGMHAYSILDVIEIKNVGVEFFAQKLGDRTLGNVSGFTEFDGTVRLLQIRNPHGKGEWKGEFSDRSDVWEKLLQHQRSVGGAGNIPSRSMKNDGVFWIDYDSFLLGFSNVDVVLAFPGNHAKSFATNFPEKKSNHRCTRAFEVRLLDLQPGVPAKDTVELYCMGIQKNRRGSTHGRADRKVSYKLSDVGILVGEPSLDGCRYDTDDQDVLEFDKVEGEMFGFRRDGHCRLVLDRKKHDRLIVMPISFGHPAATDEKRSFVLRFVADAPLLIRELPSTPRMDSVLQKFCFGGPKLNLKSQQRFRQVLLEDRQGKTKYGEPRFRVVAVDCTANAGGVVLVYLCVNQKLAMRKQLPDLNLNIKLVSTCRGMMCRTRTGFLEHETVGKGKKFQAAVRKFTTECLGESQTRLLMVLVQSGQNSSMGSITCTQQETPVTKKTSPSMAIAKQAFLTSTGSFSVKISPYDTSGIFSPGDCSADQHDAMFGSISQGYHDSGCFASSEDSELERALAISRGDLPAHHDNTANGVITHEDEELQLALKMSRQVGSGATADQAIAIDEEDDHNLQLALAASVSTAQSSAVSNKSSKDDGDCDLKAAFRQSLQTAGPSKTADKTTRTDSEDLVEMSSAGPDDTRPNKKQKTSHVSGVVEIIDDDDDEGGENEDEGEEHIEPPIDNKKVVTESKEIKEDTVAEKRRRAAEAAQIRFEALQQRFSSKK